MGAQVNTRFYPNNSFITVLNSLSERSFFSNCCSKMQKIFYEQSLFFALNAQAISDKFHQYRDSTWTQKFKIGAINGAQHALTGFLVGLSLSLALSGMNSGTAATAPTPSLLEGLAAAVIEEVFFRALLQNSVGDFQRIATCITPQCLQNNRVFKWLTSPSVRIISANLAFASVHLLEKKHYLNKKSTLIQVGRILLQPTEGILYETTGSLVAPIACHATNNFLLLSIAKFL